MSKVFRLLNRIIDVFLKILFDIGSIFLLIILKFIFLVRKKNGYKKNIICILKRYHDTIDNHQKSNHPNYLSLLFIRKPFKYSIVFCAGDGKKKIKRFSKYVVAIDIHTPNLISLKKIFPHLSNSVREFIATVQSSMFLFNKNLPLIEVDFPSNINIRAILLRYVVNVKIITKVIGNIDLIFYQTKFPIFFPFQLKSKIGRALTQLYDNIVSFVFFINCDLVTGGNKDNFDNAIAKGASPEKSYLTRIKVDKNIVNYSIISRDNLENFPKEGRIVLLWSRIAKEMMVDKAVNALIPLMKKYSDLHFVIIGAGSEVNFIKNIAASNFVSSQVHLVGYQSREYIKSAVINSDVIISPYGGSALVEAGILGAAVVAFDYEWQSEIVIHNQTGLLANYRSLQDIAEKVEELLKNPEKGRFLGEQLREFTNIMFNDIVIEESIIKAYSTLFANFQYSNLEEN